MPTTILIVDDRPVNRQYLSLLLSDHGYRVLEAANGQLALDLTRRELPDAIISDVFMPVMDGCELASRLHGDTDTAALPVIFYTATYRAGDAQALAAGCGVRHVVTKPSTPEVILRTLDDVLGREHGEAAPEEAPWERSNADLQSIGMRLSALLEVALDLSGERVPASLVNRFCRAAQNILSTQFAAVGLFEDDGKTLRHFSTSARGRLTPVPEQQAWANEFAHEVPMLLAGRPSCRVSHLSGKACNTRVLSQHVNVLAVEIRSGRRTAGWLYLADKMGAEEFSLPDEQIAQTLATQLAVFYDSARLVLDTQRQNADLKQEIARREAAEQQLRKLSSAVEHSPAAIVITNTEGLIEYVNPKFESITGYPAPEVLGQTPRLLKEGETTPEEYANLWRTIRAGGEWRGEFHNQRKNGELFWEFASISGIRDAAGVITHFVTVTEDITEKKQLAARYLRAQRLESVGALASGVAHDLNNILSPILMSAPLLRGPLGPDRREVLIAAIEQSAQRGAEVVKQMLTFTRGTADRRQVLEVPVLLSEMVKVAAESFPKSIRLECVPEEPLRPVQGNPTELHQVLMNLCVNARDAMPGGGTLRLSAKFMEIDASYASMVPDARPGAYVQIEVSDTGSGMPPEVLERIYDAFFTTKAEGQGTGLGLATARSIVVDHGGFLAVRSTVGEGTTFRVFLPAVIEAAGAPLDALPTAPPPHGNGELILVVDDEAAIRTMAQTVLETHGYEVLTAAEGTSGIALYAQHAGRIAAVLTDLSMPIMDGVAMIRALRRITPCVKVAATTGQAERDRLSELSSLGVSALLMKPYRASALLETLAGVLHTQDAGS